VEARVARGRQRAQCPRPQDAVLRDQRAVEIGRDERDVTRERVREVYEECVDW
jgi:hypothetical protein